jgi:hypothetical protein
MSDRTPDHDFEAHPDDGMCVGCGMPEGEPEANHVPRGWTPRRDRETDADWARRQFAEWASFNDRRRG